MLADNRVFDLGVDDLAALDSFILDLKDDLDIPGYEEDLLRAMVMEADEASDALLEYGTIEPEQAAAIHRNAREIRSPRRSGSSAGRRGHPSAERPGISGRTCEEVYPLPEVW